MKKKKLQGMLLFLLATITIWVNERYGLIVMPSEDMVGYQFSLFSVSTAFAGFSFTVLGILVGMSSETFIEKLKNTTIVTDKCRNITVSIGYFCVSCLLALFFIVQGDVIVDRICVKLFKKSFEVINRSFFLLEIISLFAGIVYFVVSAQGVYNLVKRVFGHKTKDYNKIKQDFFNDLEEAKGYKCEETESNIF